MQLSDYRKFLGDVWRLIKPYFDSEERWIARSLLTATISLNLALVGLSVLLSFNSNLMYTALQEKNVSDFFHIIFLFKKNSHGYLIPGFCEIAALFVPIAMYGIYIKQLLELRWRRWLTSHLLGQWLDQRVYYRMGLLPVKLSLGTENPDQRIQEDIDSFTKHSIEISVGLLSNAVTLISFIGVLWNLSGSTRVFGTVIYGYIVWIALLYAIFGTIITHLVGRPLAFLNFSQQRFEADFRFSLVRVRENAEGIALHAGEDEEASHLQRQFNSVFENALLIMKRTKLVTAITSGYTQISIIFAFFIGAPRYFAGALSLGALQQIGNSFNQVQGAFSWFVNNYADLAVWHAEVERLTTFQNAIQMLCKSSGEGAKIVDSDERILVAKDLDLFLPNGSALLIKGTFEVFPGEHLAIMGKSGSGKSTLIKALAGIWPFGSGRVLRPGGTYLFLPQRPYLPLGTLKAVLCYPSRFSDFSDVRTEGVLIDVGLKHLIPHLAEDANWSQRLSGGEQQRVAIARAILIQPKWLFLDEATSNLDAESEMAISEMLRALLPNSAIVSVTHRKAIADTADRQTTLSAIQGKTLLQFPEPAQDSALV